MKTVNTFATARVECAEAKPHGRVMSFPGASYIRPRRQRDLRAQFERLLIFVLCALWGLGMTLWALAAVSNWGGANGTASASAAARMLSNSPFSAGVQLPIMLVRHLFGW